MKPHDELLAATDAVGHEMAAKALYCNPRFIASWFPRKGPDGRTVTGWEPSGGFMAAALGILREMSDYGK